MDRYKTAENTDLYARINEAHMNAHDRAAAIRALHTAEVFANGMLWVANGVRWLVAKIFEKPASLKHGH